MVVIALEGLCMERKNKKIITLCFVFAGVLAWFVVGILMDLLSASFGILARAFSSDAIRHGVPVVVGLGLFLALQFNAKVVKWADEVVIEIGKVVWPSRKDTTAMTVVVCVMVLISGLVLGLFDMVSSFVVNLMVQVG